MNNKSKKNLTTYIEQQIEMLNKILDTTQGYSDSTDMIYGEINAFENILAFLKNH